MTSDDGYTLAETLTALAIIALAMVGVTQATRLAAMHVRTAARLHDHGSELASAQQLLGALPKRVGPFDASTNTLVGDARQVRFACDAQTDCTLALSLGGGARLRAGAPGLSRTVTLGSRAQPRFVYIDEQGRTGASWPGVSATRLSAIALMDHDDPIAILRFPITQTAACGLEGASGCGRTERGEP